MKVSLNGRWVTVENTGGRAGFITLVALLAASARKNSSGGTNHDSPSHLVSALGALVLRE